MSDPDTLKTQGNQALSAGVIDEAIFFYTQALECGDGERHVYYSNRAIAYMKKGNPSEALKDANSSINIDPTYKKALSTRAGALEKLHRGADALSAYKEALSLHPEEAAFKDGVQRLETRGSMSGAAGQPAQHASLRHFLAADVRTTALSLVRGTALVMLPFYLLSGASSSVSLFRYLLLIAACLNLSHVAKEAAPVQFNTDFAARVVRLRSTYLVMLSLTFLSSRPITLVLFPVLVFEAIHFFVWLHTILRLITPAGSKALVAVGDRILPSIVAVPGSAFKDMSFQTRLQHVAAVAGRWGAMCQILLGVWLLFALLTPRRELLATIIFWQSTRVEYMVSSDLQAGFRTVHATITGWLSRRWCPGAVRSAYIWLSDKLHSMGQPPAPPSTEAAGGGGGGGLMSSCVIS